MALSNSNHKCSYVYFPLHRCIRYTYSTVTHTYQGSILYIVSVFLPVHSCYVAAFLCMFTSSSPFTLSTMKWISSFLLLIFYVG